ncbi:MAG: hypothetical protein JZU47_05895 [Prolixibacteraceae bacterium]|nr:hypothetical protein [Prolixibacteraceae bacterium]
MTSITCPKCKSHLSDWDVICLNCGFSITPEEREKLVKEHEMQHAQHANEHNHEKELKHEKEYHFQKMLNSISLNFFKIGWTEMVVPFSIFVLILIVIVLMIV